MSGPLPPGPPEPPGRPHHSVWLSDGKQGVAVLGSPRPPCPHVGSVRFSNEHQAQPGFLCCSIVKYYYSSRLPQWLHFAAPRDRSKSRRLMLVRRGVGGGDGVLPQGQLCATTYPVRSRTTPSSPGVPSCHVTRTPSPPCTTPTLWLHSCVLQDQNCIISRSFYVNGIKQQVTFGDWLMSLRRTPRRSTGLLRVPSHCRVVVPTQAPSSCFLRTVTDGGPTGCSWGKTQYGKAISQISPSNAESLKANEGSSL